MARSGDKELLGGAKAIAEDVKLPGGGSVKLARIIDRHLEWFDTARARGLEWSDIVTILFNAGVTRTDGRPLSRGHVSSLVWRKQAATQERVGKAQLPPAPADTTGNDRDGRADTGKSVRPTRERAVNASPKTTSPSGGKRPATTKGPPAGSAKQNQDVLAFMKRAAAMRKR